MGISGISIWQLLIILAIVVMLFGTKRLRSIGSDLGSAIKGFKKSMGDEETEKKEEPHTIDDKSTQGHTAANVTEKSEHK